MNENLHHKLQMNHYIESFLEKHFLSRWTVKIDQYFGLELELNIYAAFRFDSLILVHFVIFFLKHFISVYNQGC